MLVVNGGLSPQYVLDEISDYEIDAILNRINNNYKDEWEKVRQVMYIIAQVNSTKKIKPKDVITFNWEIEEEEAKEYSKDDEIQAKNALLELAKKSIENKKSGV